MDLLIIGLLFIGVMWFMTSRTRKQQAAAMAFRDNLQPGQEVMTIGRMYGTVVEVDGTRVTLELSDGVVGVWDKDGIARLVDPPIADDGELADDADVDDDELADTEYDEYDELDEELDEELEDELAEGEVSIDDQIDEALLDEDGATDEVAAPEIDEEWSEVDVPDDASSLTDPDEDPKQPR